MTTEQIVQILDTLLKQGAFFALFVWFLYWFMFVYIPQKDRSHREQLIAMQDTFKHSLQQVVDTFKEGFEGVNLNLKWVKESLDWAHKRLDWLENEVQFHLKKK